ncbi:hypothetical protein ACFQU7_13870 [Pseudoroseomonas wenyumeiae]
MQSLTTRRLLLQGLLALPSPPRCRACLPGRKGAASSFPRSWIRKARCWVR